MKILFDIYHQQISEGNLINNIRRYWDYIGYFQVGDVPGRKEPGTGEVNWRNVFRAIHEKGYKGITGHGARPLAARHGRAAQVLRGVPAGRQLLRLELRLGLSHRRRHGYDRR